MAYVSPTKIKKPTMPTGPYNPIPTPVTTPSIDPNAPKQVTPDAGQLTPKRPAMPTFGTPPQVTGITAPTSPVTFKPTSLPGGGMVTNAATGEPTTPAPTTSAAPTEQQQVAQQPAGTYADDSPDAGKANTGDPYLDELRSGQYAGSEDWRRFSNAELKSMQKYYIGNGKFKNKYGDIVDKPDDRGPNTPAGYNGTGDFIGSGQGGAGGAGGGGGGLPVKQPKEMAGASDTIWQSILGRLNGESRYTPEAMQSIMGALKGQAENQAAGQTEAANADLAARGLARSSIGANQQLQIRAGVGQSMQQAQAGMMKAKIDADFEDKTAAIEEGLKWLDSLRSYTASMAATEAQKAAAMANIELGYAQLRQQMDYLRESYAQDLTKIGLGY